MSLSLSRAQRGISGPSATNVFNSGSSVYDQITLAADGPEMPRFARHKLTDLAMVLGVWAVAIAVIHPRGEFPILDDWDFSIATWNFAIEKSQSSRMGNSPRGWMTAMATAHTPKIGRAHV